MTQKHLEPTGEDEKPQFTSCHVPEEDTFQKLGENLITMIKDQFAPALLSISDDIFDRIFNVEEQIEEIKDEISLLLKVFTDKDFEVKMIKERNRHVEALERYKEAIKDNEIRYNNMILELKGMVSLVRSENERTRTKEFLSSIVSELKSYLDRGQLNLYELLCKNNDLIREIHQKTFIIDQMTKDNPS